MVNRTAEEVLTDIIQHQKENPKHGNNCSCMDEYIREMRRILGILSFHELYMQHKDDFNAFLQSDEWKAHQRWLYVIRTAIKDY